MLSHVVRFVFIAAGSATAQESDAAAAGTTWTKGGVGRLTFTQVSLTNWAAGGNSSISGVAFLNLFANYKKKRTTWDNTLDLAYGLIREEDGPTVKSDDRIELNSKYGQYAFKHWYYTALVNARTQFAPGYEIPGNDSTLISDFLAPAYIQTGLGMDYKPSDNFTVFIAPIAGKTTIVNNQDLANAGAFGVEKATFFDDGSIDQEGKKIRNEFGGFFKMMYKRDLGKTTKFQTKLDLFSNYLENPGNIDVNWEVLFAAKIGKYFEASLITNLIYDDDINFAVDRDGDGFEDGTGPRTQFKQVFGLGFSYKF